MKLALAEACKFIFRAALPKGAAWKPKPGGNYDKILDGVGEIYTEICTEAEKVKTVRIPSETFLLDDLERDYGILKNDALTEQERRDNLDQKKYNSIIQGNPERLEEILQKVDPNLKVYQNSPAVDPEPFIGQGFLIISEGRGDSAGGLIPEDSWPLVFFVGGAATFDVDGSILTIDEVVLPVEKETLVTDPILAYKGLYDWCAAVVVTGTKGLLKDANNNFITDAVGNDIYVLFEFDFEGTLADESGNDVVDENGNLIEIYF
jgi:hypothetical protein